jgi:hypothetical protein
VGRTDRHEQTVLRSFHIFIKSKKIAKLIILSFDLSHMEISHLENLEVNRRVILKCTLKIHGVDRVELAQERKKC